MFNILLEGGPTYPCAPGDTLLRAGLRSGLGFPYECNAGSCGTCKVQLLAGEVRSLRPDAPGLTALDRERGRVLACQACPVTDCAIKVRTRPDNVPRDRPARFTARLEGTRELTHDMREFRFSAKDAPAFRPGQYALFYLPGIEAPRTYSMSNVPVAQGEWQFIVRRVPAGAGTEALFDRVAVGSELVLDGPYGNAWLREDSPRDLVCVAGGSGLAPILSVVRGVASLPGPARRVQVFYGARAARDICGREEMAALDGFGARLRYEVVLSEPDGDWQGRRGFVHEHAREYIGPRWLEHEYYFAGPPPMVEAVQRMLVEHRVAFPQVHFDRFY